MKLGSQLGVSLLPGRAGGRAAFAGAGGHDGASDTPGPGRSCSLRPGSPVLGSRAPRLSQQLDLGCLHSQYSCDSVSVCGWFLVLTIVRSTSDREGELPPAVVHSGPGVGCQGALDACTLRRVQEGQGLRGVRWLDMGGGGFERCISDQGQVWPEPEPAPEPSLTAGC